MSLKEIAKLAGTSVATVSRVLSNPEHKCNDAQLQKRIWDIAEQLKYTPHLGARNLRMGVTDCPKPFIVDVYLTRFRSMENDAFFMELYQIIQEELLANQCVLGENLNSLDLMELGKQIEQDKHVPYKTKNTLLRENSQKLSAFVSSKKDTGLVILGKCPEQVLPILKKRYPYIVGIDRNPTEYLYDEIFCNGTTATEKAIKHLISLGHKNIAYIGDCNYEARYIGYYQTLLTHNLPLNYGYVYPTNQTREEGYQSMHAILNNPETRPSAIFCANDTTALGVLDALKNHRQKNYHPSIISIDDIEAAKHTKPMLTTISIPKREMGHLAITTHLDRRAGFHTENVRLELPCHLIERESCDYYYN